MVETKLKFRNDLTYFEITDINDIYNAIGRIIKASQDLELKYKEYSKLVKLNISQIDNSSLNILNNNLYQNKCIGKKEFIILKEIIKFRNLVNHEFFVKFEGLNDVNRYKQANFLLNNILHYINEADDFITNAVDKVNGKNIARPNLIDQLS